jgi:hypothetical protein
LVFKILMVYVEFALNLVQMVAWMAQVIEMETNAICADVPLPTWV